MSCSVHDLAEYESHGVPSVLVATEQFVTATAAQSRILGTTPAVVYVEHPVQNRTHDELHLMADGVVEALIGALITNQT